jgi:hypothetical protein
VEWCLAGGGMGQMARFRETLRRLAMIDEGFVEDQAGFGRGLAGISALDPKTPAPLQVGVPAAGASEDEIADVLLAIAPVAGLGWVVGAVLEVATALGYDGMLLDVRPGRIPRRQQGVFCAAPSSVSR